MAGPACNLALLGGALCLDFVNTVEPRGADQPPTRRSLAARRIQVSPVAGGCEKTGHSSSSRPC